MTEPLVPALHFFASTVQVRPGVKARLKLASDTAPTEGVVRAVDDDGISVEPKRPFFQTDADWDVDRPQVIRAPWAEVEDVWVRGRAIGSALKWASVLGLGLGWCGQQLDQLTDGTPRAQGVYLGLAFGFVVGLLVWLLGHEWRKVDRSTLP